ncbi:hypothetical protein [Halosimplex halophilum]|uniref:hypothetical protein n=1 Tax=Halosimplex halophilum TaxID=2559572 RepID=UPI00107FADE4|nr:hypothetical protein [Halosimplex halophilum]
MDRTLGYGLVGTIGVSASTIASAVVGDPFPVVVPSIAAGAVVAGHHLRERRDARDAQLEDDRGESDQEDDPDRVDVGDPLGMHDEEAA